MTNPIRVKNYKIINKKTRISKKKKKGNKQSSLTCKRNGKEEGWGKPSLRSILNIM